MNSKIIHARSVHIVREESLFLIEDTRNRKLISRYRITGYLLTVIKLTSQVICVAISTIDISFTERNEPINVATESRNQIDFNGLAG